MVREKITCFCLLLLFSGSAFTQNKQDKNKKRQIDSKIVRCWGIQSKPYIITVNKKEKLQKWSLENLKVQNQLSIENVNYVRNRARKLYKNKLLLPADKEKILGKLIDLGEFNKSNIKEIKNPVSATISGLWHRGHNIILIETIYGGLTVYDYKKDEIFYRRYKHPNFSKGEPLSITGGDISKDYRHIVAAFSNGWMEFVNSSTGEYLWRSEKWEECYNVRIMKNNRVVFVHKEKNVIVLNNKGKVVRKLNSDHIIATDRNKNLIFIEASSRLIKVYNIKKKEFVGKIQLDFDVYIGNSNKKHLILFGKKGEKRFISKHKIFTLIK